MAPIGVGRSGISLPLSFAGNFLAERAASLAWLHKLTPPDRRASHRHPKMGPLSAEQLLAHDLFHIRQVNDLHFANLSRQVAPVPPAYSGWEQSWQMNECDS